MGVDKVTVGAVAADVSTFGVDAGAAADVLGAAAVPGEEDSPALGLAPAAASPCLGGPAKFVLLEQDVAMTERLTIVAAKQGVSAK